MEASESSRFLGKPNLPSGVIKNDLEHILFLRKPGGYRSPTEEQKRLSRGWRHFARGCLRDAPRLRVWW